MNTSSSTTGFGAAGWLMSSVKKNPEGFLLLAAGCALLLRTGSGRSVSQNPQRPGGGEYDAGGMRRNSRNPDWGISDGVSRAAESAQEYASNIGDTVTDAANRYASTASDYAEGARRTIVDQSGRIADQAQSTVDVVVREQPLAVAIAGLAAGAAIASIFPASRMERETLGPAAQRLAEVSNTAKDRLAEAASAAGEHLKNVAEEKGLNAGGLKDVTRDVADTFEKSITGQDNSPTGEQKVSGSSGTSGSGSFGTSGASSGMPRSGSSGMSPSGSSGSAGQPNSSAQTRSRSDPKTSR
jgi:hypothetical protein